MKVRFGTSILLTVLVAISIFGCKNNIVSPETPLSAVITGVVVGSSSPSPLAGATVVLSHGSTTDSVVTGSDGVFQFIIDVPDTTQGVDVTLTIRKTGFLTRTISSNVRGDQSFPVALDIDPSAYSIVSGVVRDSSTAYPLRNASVLISLPGTVDSATTLQDGSFSINVNLQGLDSLSTTMTVAKSGFKTYRAAIVLKKGTVNVGTILLPIDQSTSFAHIVGEVTDSRSGQPLTNVSVVLSSSIITDSTRTLSDGSYSFDVNLQGPSSVSGTLTFRSSGFRDTSVSFSANAGVTTTENIALMSSYNYAIITGTVRDSASGYPLSGTSVIISLPANSSAARLLTSSVKFRRYSVSSLILDSTTTLVDGSFSMAVNLVDLQSITATMTVSKSGFKVYQSIQTFTVGTNNLGDILLTIDNSLTTAHIVGYVKDNQSQLPLTGVSVYLNTPIRIDSTKTLNDGSYSFELNLQGLSSTSGTLLFRLNSYNDTTTNFTVNAGQTFTQNISLSAKQTVVGGDSSTGRGVARSFQLINVSPNEISVHGVGGIEASTLIWQVMDSLGFPIDINHRDTVFFTITGAPVAGGAYVTPSLGITDGSGKVSTTVNSGTVSGTIQVVATLTRQDGTVIQSEPVLIVVDAGLPDQAHFSVGVDVDNGGTHNLAGYDVGGRKDPILALVGDKYGNPVRPNTAVYFTTSIGVITAAGFTDQTGHAEATLYSGNPVGNDPVFGPGYGYVKATTQGHNGVVVSDSTPIRFSAAPAHILLNGVPDSLSISVADHVPAKISVHISDLNGNPLEPGTTISTSVALPPPPPGGGGAVWSVTAQGLPSTLGDYLDAGQGSTDFTLAIAADETQGSQPTTFTVTITVSGRAGTRQAVISGTATP